MNLQKARRDPARVLFFLTMILLSSAAAAPAFAQGYPVAQPENTAAACQDGVDNDRDGYVDCQDQDCGQIVSCAAVAPGLPGLLPPRPVRPVGTGRPLAMTGLILSSISLALMTTAVVVGVLDVEGSDDGQFAASMGVGFTGLTGALVGNGLVLGALRRLRYSCQQAGVAPPIGSQIAGWVLWGLTLATPGISTAIMEVAEPPVGVAFAPPLLMALATFITVVAGWSAGAARYNAAAQRPAALSLNPFVASTTGGTAFGVAGSF